MRKTDYAANGTFTGKTNSDHFCPDNCAASENIFSYLILIKILICFNYQPQTGF